MVQPRRSSPKIDMQVSLSPHAPFDAEEIEAAKSLMRKALVAQNVAPDEVERRVAIAFSAS